MEKELAEGVRALKAHLALNVTDVKRSTEFYRRMLGVEPCKVREGYAKFDVQNPPLNLTLNQAPVVVRGALSHMGIQVASTADVLAVRGRWAEEGLVTREEMQTNCCYAVQDKTWVGDPDGNQWEVFVVLEDNLHETTACCNGASTETGEGAALACATDGPVVISSCCAGAPTNQAPLTR